MEHMKHSHKDPTNNTAPVAAAPAVPTTASKDLNRIVVCFLPSILPKFNDFRSHAQENVQCSKPNSKIVEIEFYIGTISK